MATKDIDAILPVHLDEHPLSPHSLNDSLPPGTDSQTFIQRSKNKTDFEEFVEAAARKANSKRAKWQIEVPPVLANPSISTPVYRSRMKRSEILKTVISILFVAALVASVATLILLIQEARHFGPRGWHVLLCILSIGASAILAILAILYVLGEWDRKDLESLRNDFVLGKAVVEAAEEARSEKGLAMMEVISTSDRQATQSINEAASRVRALSQRSSMLERTVEVLAFRIASLSEEPNLDDHPAHASIKSKG